MKEIKEDIDIKKEATTGGNGTTHHIVIVHNCKVSYRRASRHCCGRPHQQRKTKKIEQRKEDHKKNAK